MSRYRFNEGQIWRFETQDSRAVLGRRWLLEPRDNDQVEIVLVQVETKAQAELYLPDITMPVPTVGDSELLARAAVERAIESGLWVRDGMI